MELREKIEKFISKGTKSSIVLELLLNNKYITSTDIILYKYKQNKTIFTTSPHKIIETIRKNFGADFVQDVDIEYLRKYFSCGRWIQTKDTYKRYFLNIKEGLNV